MAEQSLRKQASRWLPANSFAGRGARHRPEEPAPRGTAVETACYPCEVGLRRLRGPSPCPPDGEPSGSGSEALRACGCN